MCTSIATVLHAGYLDNVCVSDGYSDVSIVANSAEVSTTSQ